MTQTTETWSGMPENLEEARGHFERINDLTARYRGDASLRARVDGGDTAGLLSEVGIDLPDGVEARIVADTPETLHLVMPPDPNLQLGEETLNVSAGGKTAGTAGSIGTLGTAQCSTIPSTFSSAATTGTVGSAGGD